MKINEAIELLKDCNSPEHPCYFPDFALAISLGIEALRVIKTRRKCHITGKMGLLLGETE